jgi:hypothetical protein
LTLVRPPENSPEIATDSDSALAFSFTLLMTLTAPPLDAVSCVPCT